jgi:hypothetical protein
LVLQKELRDRLAAAGLDFEWAELLRDLDRLQEVEVEQDGKRFILRTPTTGTAGKLFQTLRIALPPNLRDAASQPDDPRPEPALPMPPVCPSPVPEARRGPRRRNPRPRHTEDGSPSALGATPEWRTGAEFEGRLGHS